MNDEMISQAQPSQTNFTRRGFLAGATAAAASVLIVNPKQAVAANANSKITLGLIGCGGRGKWIANLFQQHGGYKFVATADYFADRAEGAAGKLNVPANRAFSGLSCHKRLLDAKPDAIVIESPPYFHPEQADAGVDAGCHVYCAKPIAVDVPGCLTLAETGRKGTAKKRCVLVDFQTRASEYYKEAIRRVHAVDIGPLVSGESVYYAGPLGHPGYDPKNPESRLRSWNIDRVLSGDIITEQNIHTLDVATWIINEAPQKAFGSCSKKGRVDPGTCNDHFAVLYTFPGDIALSFASKQYGTGYDDIGNRMFGPNGMIETHYFSNGITHIVGRKSYKGGIHKSLYTDGVVVNIATFHDCITKGDFSNTTVAPSVRSNLTTILGRIAAYKRTEVTWDEMIKVGEKLDFPTEGLKT